MSTCVPWLLVLAFLQAEGGTPFTAKQGNFKLTYPNEWRAVPPPHEMFQLCLRRGGNFIMVSALETPTTIEDILDGVEFDLKSSYEEPKELDRKEIKIAGARAVRLDLEMKSGGVRVTAAFTLFAHQGIAYRVVAVRALGDPKQFEKDYQTILDNFAFLAERKEWVAKFQGQPAPNALLGGLATFELNRPRWQEITLDRPREYAFLENAAYQFFPGGAWVFLRVHESRRDTAAELAELRDTLATRLQKAIVTERVDKGIQGDIPSFEITGRLDRTNHDKYLYRATAVVVDGLAMHIWMECAGSQRETTRPDWEQLLRSFRLQARSKPDAPPVYPLARTAGPWQLDPDLAVFLNQAQRVVDARLLHEFVAFSPDGRRVLEHTRDGAMIRHLAGNRSERVPLERLSGRALAWSRDGTQIVFDHGQELSVFSLDTKQTLKIPMTAADVAFDARGDHLLVSTREGGRPFGSSFTSNRLESVRLEDGNPRTLIEFPLSKVSLPTVSPDGKRLALVTNRDYPRLAPVGGHLYVAAADGSGLRQLTRDPEQITSVAWSPDGAWLYVVRRLAVGERGRVGMGGEFDLYRISPETGAATNLTRSGGLGRVWCAGADLLLELRHWRRDETQRGIFRIAAADLEKATAARPVPPLFDPTLIRKTLTAAVRKTLKGTDVKQVVPTPALLEEAAKAFAEAATAATGRRLDFTADALETMNRLIVDLAYDEDADDLLQLGAGAYLGETARRAFGAEWRIKPVPFGKVTRGRAGSGNTLVEVVAPFDALARGHNPFSFDPDDDDDLLEGRSRGRIPREFGRKMILVYPASHAADALRAETGPDYERALELADRGDVKAAVDLLLGELLRRPKNRALAREALELCEAARLPKLADDLVRRAVDAGSEAPELLLRHADLLAKTDVKQARAVLQRAAQGDNAPAGVFLRLGKVCEKTQGNALAESCWRRAYWNALPAERQEIRKLMGLPETNTDEDRYFPAFR